MPSLKHLMDELRRLRVDPDDVLMPGVLYDDFVEQAEEVEEENPDDKE